MKKFLLLLMIFFISGCASNLTINNHLVEGRWLELYDDTSIKSEVSFTQQDYTNSQGQVMPFRIDNEKRFFVMEDNTEKQLEFSINEDNDTILLEGTKFIKYDSQLYHDILNNFDQGHINNHLVVGTWLNLYDDTSIAQQVSFTQSIFTNENNETFPFGIDQDNQLFIYKQDHQQTQIPFSLDGDTMYLNNVRYVKEGSPTYLSIKQKYEESHMIKNDKENFIRIYLNIQHTFNASSDLTSDCRNFHPSSDGPNFDCTLDITINTDGFYMIPIEFAHGASNQLPGQSASINFNGTSMASSVRIVYQPIGPNTIKWTHLYSHYQGSEFNDPVYVRKESQRMIDNMQILEISNQFDGYISKYLPYTSVTIN